MGSKGHSNKSGNMGKDQGGHTSSSRRRGWVVLLFLLIFGGLGYAAWRSDDITRALSRLDDSRDAAPSPAKVEAGLIAPTFDVLRAEPSGDLIAAGRAQPNATVRVLANEQVIGTAQADVEGEWVLQPDKPLTKGDYTITLEATGPDAKPVPSTARVALSIAGGSEKPLVAVTEADKPTRVLQMPETVTEAPAPKLAEASPPVPAQGAASGQAANGLAAPATKPAPTKPAPAKPASVAEAGSVKPSATASPNASASEPSVAILQTDYEARNGSGKIFLRGTAPADRTVAVYLDNAFAGAVTADKSGKWSYEVDRKLAGSQHTFRADLISAETSRVLARAEVTFEPARPEQLAAAVPPAASTPKTAVAAGSQVGTAAPAAGAAATSARPSVPEAARPAAKPVQTAARRKSRRAKGRAVIVRRGDTLWDIAERRYGRGYRYTRIYRTNKGQIRDPNLIYPNQRIILPR
jgi:nucleoid-associated protein YgaU